MKRCFFLILLSLLGCSSYKIKENRPEGLYETRSQKFYGKIELSEDFSFTYNYKIGLIDTQSKGIWVNKGDKLLLQSEKSYLTNSMTVEELRTSNGELIIQDANKIRIEGAVVSFNDDNNSFESNEEGIVRISQNKKVTSIKVFFLGEKYVYDLLLKNSNSYLLTIYLSDLSKTYFDNELLKIKNGYISNKSGMKFYKTEN
ncbi:hypothetical protein ALW18_09575 [Flavobacterium psychrophilum]|nr:hypothetical protein ALW18_09575 [Flavobacterium psychrophilum]